MKLSMIIPCYNEINTIESNGLGFGTLDHDL